MKIFKSVFIHAVIFTLALFVFDVDLPVVAGSEITGIVLSSATFTLFGGLFTLLSVLGGVIMGVLAGAIVGGENGGACGGCAGMGLGFLVGYFLDVWLMMHLPGYFEWFPVFQASKIYVLVAVIWVLDFATADYSKLKSSEA